MLACLVSLNFCCSIQMVRIKHKQHERMNPSSVVSVPTEGGGVKVCMSIVADNVHPFKTTTHPEHSTSQSSHYPTW